jgi:hypothetical protein
MFILEAKDFTFPENDPEYAWRPLAELPQDNFMEVLRKFMKRQYRGMGYKGLKQAIEALWPNYRSECY